MILAIITLLLEIQICLSTEISRADFPHGFIFGTASSAFQVSLISWSQITNPLSF